MSIEQILAAISTWFTRNFTRPIPHIITNIKADNPMPEEPKTDIEHTDTLYPDWNTPARARHNVRAICDLEGLTLEQKNILTACVANESGFLTNPKPNQNKNEIDGEVWSTDWGIVQVNDWFHISGMGNLKSDNAFPSVDYVLSNPEACVRWMCQYYKTHGNLNAWSSFSSGVYKHYL